MPIRFTLGLLGVSFFVLTSMHREVFVPASPAAFTDSLQAERQKYIDKVKLAIKGKEQITVDSIFVNLQVLGGFPAENLVFAMDAWSKALGVSCSHCHRTDDFASDEKKQKSIARDMVNLGTMINEKLKTIDGLSKRPVVNCISCHRGTLKPALKLEVKN
ncbi:MAG: c-type cytochrome [Saprospiraceae bacterium]|nr:c-type cytochrome [Saprospiraceae bacterium]